MKKIPLAIAYKVVLGIITLVLIFHGLILLEFIPYDMVWGGRLTSSEQMIRYELSAVFINLFMAWTVAMKAKLIDRILPKMIIQGLLWVFVILFALNTVGNLLAFNSLETYIFTPVTFVSFILFLRMALEKN